MVLHWYHPGTALVLCWHWTSTAQVLHRTGSWDVHVRPRRHAEPLGLGLPVQRTDQVQPVAAPLRPRRLRDVGGAVSCAAVARLVLCCYYAGTFLVLSWSVFFLFAGLALALFWYHASAAWVLHWCFTGTRVRLARRQHNCHTLGYRASAGSVLYYCSVRAIPVPRWYRARPPPHRVSRARVNTFHILGFLLRAAPRIPCHSLLCWASRALHHLPDAK